MFYIPLWFIRFWRVFIFSITLSGITSTVLPSMTNTTQWIWSDNCGLVTKPAVSDVTGADGLNWERKKVVQKNEIEGNVSFFPWNAVFDLRPYTQDHRSGLCRNYIFLEMCILSRCLNYKHFLQGSFIHLKVKIRHPMKCFRKTTKQGISCWHFVCLLFVFHNFLAQLKRLMKETYADSTALISWTVTRSSIPWKVTTISCVSRLVIGKAEQLVLQRNSWG